jgi:choline dehydrogenase-like flavoprotein
MGLPELGGFALQWTFRHYLARRKLPYVLFPNPDGSYPIEFDSEQTPLASSRVSLTREVDSVGMRRVDLNWQINPDDLEATQRAFRLLRDVLSQNSQCRFEFDDESLAQAVSESIPGGGHHIGTTRMASSACDGVVDRDCAVFGLSNLYVASSSVFPTSSHANPTLTIVALALRLADHLKDKLR